MAHSMLWGRPEDKKYNGACIYMFLSPSGKRYVGQTTNIRIRLKGHKYDYRRKKNGKWKHTFPWARAVRKYGWNKLKFFILQKFHPDELNVKDLLNKWEPHWIKWFKSNEKVYGYNVEDGGNSRIPSVETKAKISAAMKGEKNHFFGKKHSENSLAKMSASQKGKKRSAESVAKQVATMTGSTHSAETKAKMSASAKRDRALNPRTHSAETRAKIGAASYKAVIVTFPNGKEKKFPSIKDAAEKLSITEKIKFSRGAISCCCGGKYKHTKKYKFRFA